MPNYSNDLFFKIGQNPDLLPARLRLATGETRYSTSVTIEEINSLGYYGPVDKPSPNDDQVAVWDKTNQTWVIRNKTKEELEAEADPTIRASLREILKYAVDVNDPRYTKEAAVIYSEYYAKILSLLNYTRPLTNADVPTLELPAVIYQEDLDRDRQDEINRMLTENLDNWKHMYEVYGISGWELDRCGDPDVARLFVKPADWVASGTVN